MNGKKYQVGEAGPMLQPSVIQKILKQHDKMNSEGRLLSAQKLEQCYSLFRSRFGPDQLKGMDWRNAVDGNARSR